MAVQWPLKLDGNEADSNPVIWSITTRSGAGRVINQAEHDDSLITIREALNELKRDITLPPVPTVTDNYSLLSTDLSVIFKGTGSITVILTDPTTCAGRSLHFKNLAAFTVVSASANVAPLDSETAGTAILAATAGKWVHLQSNGTVWVVMAGN